MSGDDIKLGFEFPIEDESNGSPMLGAFIILFGTILFLCLPGYAIYFDFSQKGFAPLQLFFLVFFIIGLLINLLGLSLFYYEKTVIYKDKIFYENKSKFFRNKKWEESITQYKTIEKEKRRVSGGQNSRSFTTYTVRLKHKENYKKDIILFHSTNSDYNTLTQMAQKYSDLFDLPVVEKR